MDMMEIHQNYGLSQASVLGIDLWATPINPNEKLLINSWLPPFYEAKQHNRILGWSYGPYDLMKDNSGARIW